MRVNASLLVFAALCFIWGSTWLGIKVGLESLPPFRFAGIRFAIASISLVLIARLLHARIPKDASSWKIMLFLGIFQISLPYGLVFWAEQYISSGLSAVLFATLSFFVVIFAHFIVKDERLTWLKVAGVILSFAGLVVVFWRDISSLSSVGSQLSLVGSLAVVGSSASGALANVVAKRYAERIDPAGNVLVQSTIGMIALSSVGFVTEGSGPLNFTLSSIAAALYLGVVGSALAFVGLYWLLTKATATNTSMITFATPIVAVILGWLALGEVPDYGMGLGTVLILSGVYLTIRQP